MSRRPFAWLSIDEKDNDPIVLLTYVAVALDRVSPLDPSVFDALASPGVSVEATVVPRLGAALATMDQQLVLVLDDLHLLDDPACLGRRGGARATRPGGLAADALRARRAGAAAGSAAGAGPDAGDRAGRPAHDRGRGSASSCVPPAWTCPTTRSPSSPEQTEGWSAGLYLAALSIRARGIKAKGAATFSGSDRLVSDYLRVGGAGAPLPATSFAS